MSLLLYKNSFSALYNNQCPICKHALGWHVDLGDQKGTILSDNCCYASGGFFCCCDYYTDCIEEGSSLQEAV